MPAGMDPAGAAPLGLDVIHETAQSNAPAPSALAFDGRTRDFVETSVGGVQGAHPVDAKVFLLVRTEARSIRSASDVGQTVGSIRYIDRRTIQAQVEDRIRTVLAPVVRAKEIMIRNVEIDTSTRGAVFFAVNYTNLITGKNQTAGSR